MKKCARSQGQHQIFHGLVHPATVKFILQDKYGYFLKTQVWRAKSSSTGSNNICEVSADRLNYWLLNGGVGLVQVLISFDFGFLPKRK